MWFKNYQKNKNNKKEGYKVQDLVLQKELVNLISIYLDLFYYEFYIEINKCN